MTVKYISERCDSITDYINFLNNKKFVLESSGFEVDRNELNQRLFDFQKDIVRWSLAKGRSAIFASCGLGKTIMQLEWANHICRHVGENSMVLILAPLSVSEQTVREGMKFGIDVTLCESQDDCKPGINITNYEKLGKFVAKEFCGVVLDESSILKAFTGKVRTQIIDSFSPVPYKLACTATPAPNDYMELGNHSEFIGVMTRSEMLSMFFVHDGGHTSKWRLKGHCDDLFWQWMASWAVVIDNPADLGYTIEGYDLPPMNIHEIIVDADDPINETLTLAERRVARRESLELRCQKAADIANSSDEQFIIWCNLNDEQNTLAKLVDDNVSVQGSTANKRKIEYEHKWRTGGCKSMISKPLVYGYGLNWQHCHNIIFTGLSDSFEQYYQALRRCWRFGQNDPVNVYIVISAKEGCVKDNIERKENDFVHMREEMLKHTKEITKKELQRTSRLSTPYNPQVSMVLPRWNEFVKCAV